MPDALGGGSVSARIPDPLEFCYRDDGDASRRNVSADVAQLVAHHLAKVRVAGSNPVVRSGTGFDPWFTARAISSAGEHFPDTEGVTGSIPVSRTSSTSRG